jgi:porphobilinogen synthase
MPPHCQLSIDMAVEECREFEALGIGGVILFGLPESKDEEASGAYDDNGIVQRAIRAIKREVPDLLVITDVCNCEYTSHGHCGKVVAMATSITTRRSNGWRSRRCRTRGPAPISWRRRT